MSEEQKWSWVPDRLIRVDYSAALIPVSCGGVFEYATMNRAPEIKSTILKPKPTFRQLSDSLGGITFWTVLGQGRGTRTTRT
jgi:hypothetical protein